MSFELVQDIGIKTHKDLCIIEQSSLEELEDNTNTTLAKLVLDCRKLEDLKNDNPAWAIKRLNDNGIASIRDASIDDIGSFNLRGFNIAHLIVLGEITSYGFVEMKMTCPESLSLLLKTRSSNVLQLLPIELAAYVARTSAKKVMIASCFYSEDFADSLFSQVLQTHYALNLMYVVDAARLLHLAILSGNTCVIKYLHSVFSQFGLPVDFRGLVLERSMHTLSVVNYNSLLYIASAALNNSDSDMPLYYIYDSRGMLPIHFAALNGFLACVIQLLRYDKGMIHVLTKDTNINILGCAISSNSVECVAAIIALIQEVGGKVALKEQLKHRFGRLKCNALGLAILYNNKDIISLLMQHSTVDDVAAKMLPLQMDDEPQVQLPLMNAFLSGCTALELLFYTEQYSSIYNFITSRPTSEKRRLFDALEEMCGRQSVLSVRTRTLRTPRIPRSQYSARCFDEPTPKDRIMGQILQILFFRGKRSASPGSPRSPLMPSASGQYLGNNSFAYAVIRGVCSPIGIITGTIFKYLAPNIYVIIVVGFLCDALVWIFFKPSMAVLIQKRWNSALRPEVGASLPNSYTWFEDALKSGTFNIEFIAAVLLSVLFLILTMVITKKRTAPLSFLDVPLCSSGTGADCDSEKIDVKVHAQPVKKAKTHTHAHTHDSQAVCICDVVVSRTCVQVVHSLSPGVVNGDLKKDASLTSMSSTAESVASVASSTVSIGAAVDPNTDNDSDQLRRWYLLHWLQSKSGADQSDRQDRQHKGESEHKESCNKGAEHGAAYTKPKSLSFTHNRKVAGQTFRTKSACLNCLAPEKGTYCYFCSACIQERIFHSHILNSCIVWSNLYSYILSITFFYIAGIMFLLRSPVYAFKVGVAALLLIFLYLIVCDFRY